MLLKRRVDRHQKNEDIAFEFTPRPLASQRDFQLRSFAQAGAPETWFRFTVPDRISPGVITAKLFAKPGLRTKLFCLFNAVTNKRQHRSSIDLEHKPLLFRVLSSAQFCPTGPVILAGANTMSSPIFRSAVIA